MTHGPVRAVTDRMFPSASADGNIHGRFRRLSRLWRWQTAAVALCVTLLILTSAIGHTALRITQSPAELHGNGGQFLARAHVEVLRFERIELRYFDPAAGDPLYVTQGNLASPDSLTGTPSLGAAVPDPLDRNGNAIVIDAPVPLSPANGYTFGGQEAVFIVADSPLLPSARFSTRPDGRRFMAVTVDISNGDSHTVALVETAAGSGRYVGYLQPNTSGSPVVIPPGGSFTVRYDIYGDVEDSATLAAPWNVNPAFLATVQSARTTQFTTTAVPPSTASGLFLTKQSLRASAMTGDFIAWDLRLENTTTATIPAVQLTDTLPVGFRYQAGSLRVNGIAMPDPAIDASGRVLDIALGDVAAGAAVTLRYVAEVSVSAPSGTATNKAIATSGSIQSNLASATVNVEKPFFQERAFLMGRVIAGECGEADGPGLGGVRLYMEDGTNVITDSHGRWHIEGVTPGTHVLQLDTITLGPRHTLRHCNDNTRKAGNAASRFVNVQGGTLWRENWYVEERPRLDAHLQQQLITQVVDGKVRLTLRIANGDTAFGDVTTRLYLPDGLRPVPGSVTLDNKSFSDPAPGEDFVQFDLGPQDFYQEHTLSLLLALDSAGGKAGEAPIVAESVALAHDGQRYQVSSTNGIRIERSGSDAREIMLQQYFASMSRKLSGEDRAELAATAETLRESPGVSLEVTGHSDGKPVVSRQDRLINDNYALSEARASAVAEYVDGLLALPDENITVIGKGAEEPIGDNSTAAGRSLNRRVDTRFLIPATERPASVSVTNEDSGLDRDRTGLDRNVEQDSGPNPGFVNVADGMVTPYPVINVTARLDSRLKPRLLLDGEAVPAERIGMTLADKKTGETVYSWVGIELSQQGEYRFELEGTDGFGIARFREQVMVRRSGRIKSIELVEAPENTADGLTPVRARLRILDEFNQPVLAQTELKIVSGALKPLNYSQTRAPLTDPGDTLIVDRDGYAWFEPVSTAGTYRVRLTDGNVLSEEIEIPVSPALRDWILVGFAEGTIGYNTLSDNMRELGSVDAHAFTDGEASFFARGTVKGEWLLTAAYDTRGLSTEGQPLGQAIDPQRWYALYGDDTLRMHDAPSSKKLYVRMEKRDFYALFGDYDTGLTVTELGRYQRVLTGAKAEWSGRNITAMGFAAESPQGYVRDDIAPDGTSGLYRTTRAPIIPGSETITIEVRDRFTNEVLSSTPMTRFVDYSLDPVDGTFYFRQPVPVQDASFNPQRIVVQYEVDTGMENTVAGGRVTVSGHDGKLVAGFTGVYDATTGTSGRLGAADLLWKPDEHHTVKAEIAGTRESLPGGDDTEQAWLVEHRYASEKLDTRARAEQTESGFGLGQLAPDDDDKRLMEIGARYRFSETVAVSGDISRQELLQSDNRRDMAEGRVEYEREDWLAWGGVRVASDQTGLSEFTSRQLIVGGQRELLDRRVILHASGETSLDATRENFDYPNRFTVGADYQLNEKVSLFANQELTWGHERRTQDTRIGARATPWRGGTVTSEVSRTMDEYGPRLMAHAGLFQTIELTSQWNADFGFDRAQTLVDGTTSAPFDPRRVPASGTLSDDYTAVSAGIGYRDASWQWTNRVEMRWADTDDKWNLMSGLQHRLNDVDTLAARLLHFDQEFRNGDTLRSSELEASWARRPLDDGLIWLNRTRLIYDEQRNVLGAQFGHRVVNNTHLNMTWRDRHQLSMQYGARYVGETIDEERFEGYTDLIAGEYRYDITRRWDLGVRGSTLAGYNSDVRMNSFGVMAGFSPIRDVWLSLGYNFRGFYDSDFDGATGRVQGIVLDFRIKFDQRSVRRHLGRADDEENTRT